MHLVIVGQADRRRENLFSMLESIEIVKSIKMVETCKIAISEFCANNPITVLVDCRYPEKEMDKEIGKLLLCHKVDHIILLKSHSSPNTHFTHFTTSEIFYDELTTEILFNLIKKIQYE